MKNCSKCKINKSISEFHKNAKRKDGLQSLCKDCVKLRDKIRNSDPEVRFKMSINRNSNKGKIRQLYYSFIKDKSCAKCTENHISCLQFHHRIRTEKEFNVSEGICRGYGWNRILQEIEKCDILCANCHHKLTAIESNWYKDM